MNFRVVNNKFLIGFQTTLCFQMYYLVDKACVDNGIVTSNITSKYR